MNNIDPALRSGSLIDASFLLDEDMTARVDELFDLSLSAVEYADTAELQGIEDIVGTKIKPTINGQTPYLSVPNGWNEESELGLRIPNPSYPQKVSSTIVLQVSNIAGFSEPTGNGVLDNVNRVAHETGNTTLQRVKSSPALGSLAASLDIYEVRVTMNVGMDSKFTPLVTGQVMQDEHTDSSIATVGLRATHPGFEYLAGDDFMPPVHDSFLFLGTGSGIDDAACRHRVVRNDRLDNCASNVNEGFVDRMSGLGIVRMAANAFLKPEGYSRGDLTQ